MIISASAPQPPPQVDFTQEVTKKQSPSFLSSIQRSISNLSNNFYEGVKDGFKNVVPVSAITGVVMNALFNTDGCDLFNEIKSWEAPAGLTISITAPLTEELVFRVALQQGMLKPLIQKSIQLLDPKKEDPTLQKISQVGHIALSTALFSYCHLDNLEVASPEYVFVQIMTTLAMGISAGKVMDSQAGLAGAFGVHFITNFLGWLSMEASC